MIAGDCLPFLRRLALRKVQGYWADELREVGARKYFVEFGVEAFEVDLQGCDRAERGSSANVAFPLDFDDSCFPPLALRRVVYVDTVVDTKSVEVQRIASRSRGLVLSAPLLENSFWDVLGADPFIILFREIGV